MILISIYSFPDVKKTLNFFNEKKNIYENIKKKTIFCSCFLNVRRDVFYKEEKSKKKNLDNKYGIKLGSIFFWYIVKFQNLPIPIKNKLIPSQVAKKFKIHNISSFTAKKSNKCNELNVLVLGWIFYIFKSSIIQVWISLISIRCDSVLKISNISKMSSVWFNYFF